MMVDEDLFQRICEELKATPQEAAAALLILLSR